MTDQNTSSQVNQALLKNGKLSKTLYKRNDMLF